jgi:hypothetical protein
VWVPSGGEHRRGLRYAVIANHIARFHRPVRQPSPTASNKVGCRAGPELIAAWALACVGGARTLNVFGALHSSGHRNHG